jgi:hypothetical protein
LQGKPLVLTTTTCMPSRFIHAIANRVSNLVNYITAGLAQVVVHNTREYAENSPFLRRYLDKLVPVYPPVELVISSPEEREAFRLKFKIEPGQRIIGMAAPGDRKRRVSGSAYWVS